MDETCGCDVKAWNESCVNYIKSKFGVDKNGESWFLSGELNICAIMLNHGWWWKASFDPFAHGGSGIWDGVVIDKNHEVFGLVYEEADCSHATDRANLVSLIKFYEKNRKVYEDLINAFLPMPIAEEIIPEFFFVHTFNDVELEDRDDPDPEYILSWDKQDIEVHYPGNDFYFLRLSKWYLEIDNIIYKWDTAGPVLENYLGQSFISFQDCLNFLLSKRLKIEKN